MAEDLDLDASSLRSFASEDGAPANERAPFGTGGASKGNIALAQPTNTSDARPAGVFSDLRLRAISMTSCKIAAERVGGNGEFAGPPPRTPAP